MKLHIIKIKSISFALFLIISQLPVYAQISTITETTYSGKLENGIVTIDKKTGQKFYSYNKHNKLLKYESKNEYGDVWIKGYYEYANDSILIEYTEQENNKKSQLKYSYLTNGLINSTTQLLNANIIYTENFSYNSDKLLHTKTKLYNTDSNLNTITKYEYNNKKKLISERVFKYTDSNLSLAKYYDYDNFGNQITDSLVRYNNAKNAMFVRVIKSGYTNNSNLFIRKQIYGQQITTEKFDYDSNNNLKSKETFNNFSNNAKMNIFEYEYDVYKNWIKQIEKKTENDKTEYFITERKIKYFN